MCFVAFPTNPFSAEPQKLREYLNSLKVMKKNKALFSLVIELPYSFHSTETLWDSFKIILDKQKDLPNLRLRIWSNKAVFVGRI